MRDVAVTPLAPLPGPVPPLAALVAPVEEAGYNGPGPCPPALLAAVRELLLSVARMEMDREALP